MPISFKTPDYPDNLLAKTWDKKKSLAAKTKVKETGIGEAMKAAKKAYDGVDWPKLEALNNRPDYNSFHVQAWNQALNDAKAVATGKLRIFQLALDAVRDAADKAGKRLAEHKLKDDVKLVEAISSTADELAGPVQANVVLPVLISLHRDHLAVLAAPFANVRHSVTKNINIVLEAMVDVKAADYDTVVFSSKVAEVRKVAQLLGNLKDHVRRGFVVGQVDVDLCDSLFLEMKDWRNGKPHFPKGTPPATVMKEVYKVRETMTRVVKVFA